MNKLKKLNTTVSMLLCFLFFFSSCETKSQQNGLDYNEAQVELNKLLKDIHYSENYVQRREKVNMGQKKDLKNSLPEIHKFDLVVDPPSLPDHTIVEIFTSTEKSGTGVDGIAVELANDFNDKNIKLEDGNIAKVKVRKIASGTGYQFIASGKYRPDAFSPSNHLWIEMSAFHKVNMTKIKDVMFENVAGIVMKKSVAGRFKSNTGRIDVENLINEVVQGNLVMGYTNPFASSTGLNFLVTVLSTFAKDDESKMLSPEVISSFSSFQKGVPFVALTTLQMRESVENDGSLDAFVMEYQTFYNSPQLKSDYEFIPFGINHSNPLYAVGNLSKSKMEVLRKFADFSENDKYKKLKSKYGFKNDSAYKSAIKVPTGKTLIDAQKLWKQEKDAGRPIAAIFLCDVSGSMDGVRIKSLKKALLSGSEFISPNNSIGIVTFNSSATVRLPIKQFNLNHKAAFHAAVKDLSPEGKTSMYDGIAVSLTLLEKEREKNPNIKPLLFVLTDGETNMGIDFGTLSPVISGLNIPVYTIGYEANIDDLKRISSLVEATSLNAKSDEIEYKIGSILNAQM